jgi:hypothetical protein
MLMGVTSWELGALRVPLIMVPDSSRNGMNSAVFLSERSVKGRSDCSHFDLADWGARVRIRCQAIPALNAHAIRSVDEAIWPRSLHDKVCPSWASGEPRVRLLTERTLGRGVNSSGTTVLARGWARMRSCPLVDEALTWNTLYQLLMVCSEDVFQPCLGALGVPLITVPDKSWTTNTRGCSNMYMYS